MKGGCRAPQVLPGCLVALRGGYAAGTLRCGVVAVLLTSTGEGVRTADSPVHTSQCPSPRWPVTQGPPHSHATCPSVAGGPGLGDAGLPR